MTKDARTAFVRAAGIFIMYLTHCANDFCRESGRQTIQANDVRNAIKELNFEEIEEPLEEFLRVYRREQAEEKASKKAKGVSGGGGEVEDSGNTDLMDTEDFEEA